MGPKPAQKNEDDDRARGRVCPVCKGTGINPAIHFRFTTGGKDDRSCPRCLGEGLITSDDDARQGK